VTQPTVNVDSWSELLAKTRRQERVERAEEAACEQEQAARQQSGTEEAQEQC
jgi:hypothetical protein